MRDRRIIRPDEDSLLDLVIRVGEVDLLLAGDVAVFAGADGEPGRQAGDVRGKQVLAGDGDTHLEDRPQQHEIGRLAAGTVDGRDLDAEVVDDA